MAHNFKRIIEGAYYVSKAGHDSNDGLSPDTPKRSLSASSFPSNSTIVIGSGHYTGGDFSRTNYGKILVGDGKVILDNITTTVSNYYYGAANISLNIEFRNTTVSSRGGAIGFFTAKNCELSSYIQTSIFRNAILIDSTIGAGSYGMSSAFSILMNCSGFLNRANDCYVNKSTDITFNVFADINNSNYRGIFTLLGTYFSDGIAKKYAIKDLMTGTPFENNYPEGVKWFSEQQLIDDGYTGTNLTAMVNSIATCINRDPLFNDESINDFTLQASSPHIGTASNGTNIGGTEVAVSIKNNDSGTNVEIIPSPEIDTFNPNSYVLKENEDDGYIDYIQKIASNNVVVEEISPIAQLEFNSDVTPGNIGNRNVPDSEPLTIDYPREFLTTSVAADASTLNITGHDAVVGEHLRILGEDRSITAIAPGVITVNPPFRAIVPSGTKVQISTKINIGALKPNRLTYMMRTSKQDDKPQIDTDWDNDVDPIYNMSGKFLTHEWDKKPQYVIDTIQNKVFGSMDSEAPVGLAPNDISCKWIHVRVYLRNNYKS